MNRIWSAVRNHAQHGHRATYSIHRHEPQTCRFHSDSRKSLFLDIQLLMALAGVVLALVLWPGRAHPAAGASGAEFLLIAPGARPAAMGGAYTATAADAFSSAYNPAGYGRMPNAMLSFTHNEWLQGVRHEFMGFGMPIARGGMGMSITYVSLGSFDGRDNFGKPTSSFGGRDMSVSLGYGLRVTPNMAVGVQARGIRQTLAGYTAMAVSGDIGMTYQTPLRGLSLGAALSNFGTSVKFIQDNAALPWTMAVGAAAEFYGFTVTMDVKHRPKDQTTELAFGTEYGIGSREHRFCLRGGYAAAVAGVSKNPGTMAGMGAGAGMKMGRYALDYAFTPLGDLGSTHRLSMSVNFGKPRFIDKAAATKLAGANDLPGGSQNQSASPIELTQIIPAPANILSAPGAIQPATQIIPQPDIALPPPPWATVQFAANDRKILPDSADVIRQTAEFLKARPDYKVSIIVRQEQSTDIERAQRVALVRGFALMDALAECGVGGWQISVEHGGTVGDGGQMVEFKFAPAARPAATTVAETSRSY